jgi:hypothetical protein
MHFTLMSLGPSNHLRAVTTVFSGPYLTSHQDLFCRRVQLAMGCARFDRKKRRSSEVGMKTMVPAMAANCISSPPGP